MRIICLDRDRCLGKLFGRRWIKLDVPFGKRARVALEEHEWNDRCISCDDLPTKLDRLIALETNVDRRVERRRWNHHSDDRLRRRRRWRWLRVSKRRVADADAQAKLEWRPVGL